MKYDNLWAPWRSSYITGDKPVGCVFCEKLSEDKDSDNLILHRGKSVAVIMNLFPYNSGHLLLIPYRHISDLTQLEEYESHEIDHLAKYSVTVIRQVMSPQGFNLGYNLGSAAGAGIESHLHKHIVPRWNGDTNFMPIIGGTKVISQDLYKTYELLKEKFVPLNGV